MRVNIGFKRAFRSEVVKATNKVENTTPTTLTPPTIMVVNNEGYNRMCNNIGMMDDNTMTKKHLIKTFNINVLILKLTLLQTNHIRTNCMIITNTR